jgi:hypothetical protein
MGGAQKRAFLVDAEVTRTPSSESVFARCDQQPTNKLKCACVSRLDRARASEAAYAVRLTPYYFSTTLTGSRLTVEVARLLVR